MSGGWEGENNTVVMISFQWCANRGGRVGRYGYGVHQAQPGPQKAKKMVRIDHEQHRGTTRELVCGQLLYCEEHLGVHKCP